jgi:hypothetical protein
MAFYSINLISVRLANNSANVPSHAGPGAIRLIDYIDWNDENNKLDR